MRDDVSAWRRRWREVTVAELVVRRALARLTATQRAVVVLRHVDD